MGTEEREVEFIINGVGVALPVHIPKFATGGIIKEPYEAMCELGESFIPTHTMVIKFHKKSVRKLKRKLQRELLGSNNRRKRHGLPMYRKWA